MAVVLILLFVLGYLAIIFEHTIKLDKTASALLTATLCWTAIALAPPETGIFNLPGFVEFAAHRGPETGPTDGGVYLAYITHSLAGHMEGASQILFFILGAMVIVELVDAHNGFQVISGRIKATRQGTLLVIVTIITFFLSAILDNLTTAIVMMSMMRRLLGNAQDRMLFAGLIVIAANAGGAWSPMGDVTTTMLWIGGQIGAGKIITTTILPSLVCAGLPVALVYWQLRNRRVEAPALGSASTHEPAVPPAQQQTMFWCGIGALLFVPVFKTVTHLPPYLGMLLGLGFVWFVSEIIHRNRDQEERTPFSAAAALRRIDAASVLFFLGILLAIGALETMEVLHSVASGLDSLLGNKAAIAYVIGLLSAVVDNVPLVAAAMGMYPLETFPKDDPLWLMLAYSTGTGGSILIIGSAAGVAIMGMEKLEFLWYLRRIGGLALLGYTAGMVLLAVLV